MAADVAQLVFNGLLVGSVFALGAVGLTLVYGILRLANFAHGDLLTTGGFAAWVVIGASFALAPGHLTAALAMILLALSGLDLLVTRRLHRSDHFVLLGAVAVLAGITLVLTRGPSRNAAILAGLVTAAVSVALLSVVLDRVLWRKLRRDRANVLTLMIVSIGVAFVLRSALQMVFGGSLHGFFRGVAAPNPAVGRWLGAVGLSGLRVSTGDLWIVGSAVVAVVVTTLVLTRTRSGKAMRALADNRDLALVSGIDTDRIILHVWVLGGALAGLAGPLLALHRTGFVDVNIGWDALLSIFAAVILGGIGSATGAMVGGLLIGVAQELSVLVIPSHYKIAVGFAILIVTLLVRPQGLLGVRE